MTTRPHDGSASSLPGGGGHEGPPSDPYCHGAFFSGAAAGLPKPRPPRSTPRPRLDPAQAQALEDFLGSSIQLGEVAELLGMSKRNMRNLCAATRERLTKASGPMNGSVALEAQTKYLAG